MKDPVHVIAVIDENFDEALYVGGDLHPIDGETIYVTDIVDATRGLVVQFSQVHLRGTVEDEWPKYFEELMQHVKE